MHTKSTDRQYNFVDMTGQTIAGALVVRRAANVNGNSRWLCKLACGHEQILQGIALRAAAKEGRTPRCKGCRPKRPGTVVRRA